MKQKNLLIICITLIIVVAIGAFAFIYVGSTDNNQDSKAVNNSSGGNSGTVFTNKDLAKDNTETYGLNVGNKDIIFIKGYGSKEKIGDSGQISESGIYGELILQEKFKITLSNGDWYTIAIAHYDLDSSLNNGKNQAIYSGPNSGVNPNQDYPCCGYTYSTGDRFYDIGIMESNNPAKYKTVDFLKSILYFND